MEVMERYQILLEKDPRSQVFAPLAEAYRKMGLIEEAFRICVRGVQYHPHFSGGRIALAKVLLDRENKIGALQELQKAVDISPDNILAHQMLGELHLNQKNAKEALRAYKMVLFLAPNNERAQKAVKKLEALTADEFDEDIFAMRPLRRAEAEEQPLEVLTPLSHQHSAGSEKIGDLDRYLSLADAYMVRNDFDRASATLHEADRYYSHSPDLVKRLQMISQRTQSTPAMPGREEKPKSRSKVLVEEKIELLSDILQRFQSRSHSAIA
jgi:tetratricopeptide (TPR) repeat protein